MQSVKHQADNDWAFRVSPGLAAELDEFQKTVEQFRTSAISEAQFRAIRVPQGIYEQRKSGTYMLRVRFPAGGVLPDHLRRLGEVASSFGNGVLHITTRQEFQVHRVPLESIPPALRSLAAAGLSTKGGGGNTVRNVTACFDSGVCPHEVFDVAPYAVALTERFMPDPLSFQLPRKYKIAFAACNRDCSGATVNDVGFIARRQNDTDGFAVYVAGGMGGKSRVATLLHEFIPASDAFLVAEAVKRVFDKNGDRKNKHLARLRFPVERIGLDAFRELYEKELAALRASAPASLQIRPYPSRNLAPAKGKAAGTVANSTDFARWFASNVIPQKQPGFFMVHIPLALGDLPVAKTAALANIVATHGDGILCATQSQNLVLRWVAESELPSLREKLDTLGLATPDAPVLRNLVACAGASTCRLGICLSRGLAKAIRQELTGSQLKLENLGDLTIHISGCPNSCGRHPVGNIGFSGAARRVDGRLIPYYAVQLGGRVTEGQTRFGTNVGAIPARNAPAFVRDFLAAWQRSAESADFHRFVDNDGRTVATELIERHQQAPSSKQNKEFFFDWDAPSAFSLAGRGAGECGAGVFDLIEVDLANARESLEAGRLYGAALSAARALLVTRNLQPKSDREAFELFQNHFVAEGLVDAALTEVIRAGSRAASEPDPAKAFAGRGPDVTALVASVRLLYENMDASLRFKPVTPGK
jgi:sulfite reductase (ferredoxin)